MKRRTVLALAACASLIPFPALAQAGVPRIGFLGLSTPAALSPLLEALRASLRERGLVEGKNIVIEARFAEGRYERLGGLAAELPVPGSRCKDPPRC